MRRPWPALCRSPTGEKKIKLGTGSINDIIPSALVISVKEAANFE